MNVLQAAREVARSYKGGIVALANRLGKNPTTLAHEVSPPVGSLAKLGLATAVAITDEANDDRILQAFAQHRHYRCVRVTLPARESAKDLTAAALEFSRCASESLACMHRAITQGHVTENQVHTFERDVSAIATAAATVAERMRVLAEHQAKARAMPRAGLPIVAARTLPKLERAPA